MTMEQYSAWQNARISANKHNDELIENKIQEINLWVKNEYSKTFPESGLVFTKLYEDIQTGYFQVWVGKGVSSPTFVTIHPEDIEIEPLKLKHVPEYGEWAVLSC